MDDFDKTIQERKKKEEYDAIKEVSFDELNTIFHKWLLIVDPGVIKLLIAIVFANKLPSDPVWLNLIAPSAGGKTELLNGFLKVPECYQLSSLTSNTFLSGYKSKDKVPSLLHQLDTGKTIIFKDFTSLLDGNYDELKAIMGQLREIFDGYAIKRLGTGDEIKWKGKLGFIAGSTPIIEQRLNLIGAMGERFLNYYMKQPKRAALRDKMRANIGKEEEMRSEIQDGVVGFLKRLKVPDELPKLPENVEKIIEGLTDFIAISRAVVIRGFDSKKEIDWIAPPEMSGRVFKQFYTLAIALMIINGGEWKEEDNYILRQLAISSIHSLRYGLIKEIGTYKGQVKTSTLAISIGYPTSTTRRYLEDLAAISMDDGSIKIIRRTHQGKGKADLWELTQEMRNILTDMGEIIIPIREDSELTADEEDIPLGTSGNGKYRKDEDLIQEAEDLAADLPEEERQSLGI